MSGWKHWKHPHRDGNYRSSNKNEPYRNSRQVVPKGWIECPRISFTVIANTFMAFKTPLDSKYDRKLFFRKRFNKEMLFSSMDNIRVSLGLWIDLTNTDRYYNGFEIYGYVKIPCSGHNQPPTREQAQLFVDICSNFVARNNFQCIGVHCTHGFNRTGFMIATYLIEILNYDVTSAIAEFAGARPPGIYKQVFIDELFRRYSRNEVPILAPEFPTWCLDS